MALSALALNFTKYLLLYERGNPDLASCICQPVPVTDEIATLRPVPSAFMVAEAPEFRFKFQPAVPFKSNNCFVGSTLAAGSGFFNKALTNSVLYVPETGLYMPKPAENSQYAQLKPCDSNHLAKKVVHLARDAISAFS